MTNHTQYIHIVYEEQTDKVIAVCHKLTDAFDIMNNAKRMCLASTVPAWHGMEYVSEHFGNEAMLLMSDALSTGQMKTANV